MLFLVWFSLLAVIWFSANWNTFRRQRAVEDYRIANEAFVGWLNKHPNLHPQFHPLGKELLGKLIESYEKFLKECPETAGPSHADFLRQWYAE